MNRELLVEAMARAAWEDHDGMDSYEDIPPWNELPDQTRNEWLGYQRSALVALEGLIPELSEILQSKALN